jgi:hypothetical protein
VAARSRGARRPKELEANPEVPSTRSAAGATASQPPPLRVVVGQMFLLVADVAPVKGAAAAAVAAAASGPAGTVVGVGDTNVSPSAHTNEYFQTTPRVHVTIVGTSRIIGQGREDRRGHPAAVPRSSAATIN